MGSLFSELKRRKVFRVTAAYLVGAWAILEFVSVVSPMLRLPDWIGAAVLLLLTIGLVGAVALSWMFEVTADGLRRTEPAAGAGGPANSKLDWALMAASAAIVAVVSYQQIFARAGSAGGPGESSVMNAPAGSISIAVLPFVNLSSDPEQEFFSDGMTEEITSALAKVKGLRVVGRTSAFEFKGQNKDLRAIGQALGTTNLLEGSVRKVGNRVRITGQLIRASDGSHIWTENYDRELTDIFAAQDEIAQAIAAALQVPLGLKTGETLITSQPITPESYQQYLQAKALWRMKSSGGAIGLLEQVVARDPGYAPAWAMLASLYFQTPQGTAAWAFGTANEARLVVDAWMPKADTAVMRAIQLDPTLADGHVALGVLQIARGNYLLGEASLSKALSLDPNNPDGLYYFSNMLARVGKVKEARAMKLKLQALEPLVPLFTDTAAVVFWLNGENDAAIAMMKEIPPGLWSNGPIQMYASLGRYTEAANALREMWESDRRGGAPPAVEEALRLLRTAPASASSLQTLPYLGSLSWIYLYVGFPERALENREREFATGYTTILGASWLWHPSYAVVRKTERFKSYVRKAGLVDYWRARGWPDICRPVGADDFECD